MSHVLEHDIDLSKVSTRLRNVLEREDIKTVEQLAARGLYRFRRYNGVGKQRVVEASLLLIAQGVEWSDAEHLKAQQDAARWQLEVRFWSNVRTMEEGKCWLWKGAVTEKGYGQFWEGKAELAHHVAFQLKRGVRLKPGTCLMHTCDVRLCVNPDHLKIGTRAQNNADRDAKGRGRWHKGEKHGRAKLTAQKVKTARLMHEKAGWTIARLARDNKVSESSMRNAIQRKTWRSV